MEWKNGFFWQTDAAQGLDQMLANGQSVQLCYMNPPYLTGKDFGKFDDRMGQDQYYAMMREVLCRVHTLLAPTGSLFLHVDYRTHPRLRLMLDEIFTEKCFLNEIIWAYQTGGRSTHHFSRKHDVILFYAKDIKCHFFAPMEIARPRATARINHMRRGVDEMGRAYRAICSNGKEYRYYEQDLVPPSDVWEDIPHMQQKSPERTGYPTQKPLALMERIIKCASRPGDTVLDCFAGSGTTLVAATTWGRRFVGMDASPHALPVIDKRLKKLEEIPHTTE